GGFRKAVLDSLEGGTGEMEPIVFRDVHPFYALADIRGSSTNRAWSIQVDLLHQLGLAEAILETAHRVRPMAILDQLRHKVERQAAAVEVSLRSGDEAGVVAVLRAEGEAVFPSLGSYGPGGEGSISACRAAA